MTPSPRIYIAGHRGLVGSAIVRSLQAAGHKEAVRLARSDPALVQQALNTVERWLKTGDSRCSDLWREWQEILRKGTWRKVLGRTRRAQALRQASPLATVLPENVRQGILAQVRLLKNGVVLGDAGKPEVP